VKHCSCSPGTAALPDQLLAVGRAVHQKVRAGSPRALNHSRMRKSHTIAELIIPKTGQDGRGEAG